MNKTKGCLIANFATVPYSSAFPLVDVTVIPDVDIAGHSHLHVARHGQQQCIYNLRLHS
ncbi:hypothetical protein ACVUXH_004631 [Salmonella enterica subsp. enterica serovar Infantis]